MDSLKVAYDGQVFLSPTGGAGKGTQLRNLLGSCSNEFIGFASKGRSYFSDVQLVQGGWSGYNLWQQLSLPLLIRRWKPDFFLAPYNTAPIFVPSPTKLILVLHDLIMFEYHQSANFRSKIRDVWRRSLVPMAVSKADVVITVSDYSKAQILKRFPKARVEIIPCSIAPSWFVGVEEPLHERSNYILMVTGDVPHKNLDRGLAAYAAYATSPQRRNPARLKIVGASKAERRLRDVARTLGVADSVDIEPFLEEQDLQKLYRRSRASLFPSLVEGFGIPVLEAMASGTPIISSNAASLPEVGGAAPFYFDPTDVNAIAAAIDTVMGDEGMQRSMIERGLERAQRFHPDIVGAQVQAFWQDRASSLLEESSRERTKSS